MEERRDHRKELCHQVHGAQYRLDQSGLAQTRRLPDERTPALHPWIDEIMAAWCCGGNDGFLACHRTHSSAAIRYTQVQTKAGGAAKA
jgi:hypothetical protein